MSSSDLTPEAFDELADELFTALDAAERESGNTDPSADDVPTSKDH
jgi:hypothetical protein